MQSSTGPVRWPQGSLGDLRQFETRFLNLEHMGARAHDWNFAAIILLANSVDSTRLQLVEFGNPSEGLERRPLGNASVGQTQAQTALRMHQN